MLSDLYSDVDYLQLKNRINTPNIFIFLKNANYEIRHSNFISWLLDPQETHGQGSYFLDVFLRYVEHGFILKGGVVEFSREWRNIDILIKFEESIVVIENKTKSRDAAGQLKKYRDIVAGAFPNHKKIFVYWTVSGEAPQDESELNHWKSFLYESFVLELDNVLATKDLDDKVKHYIADYVEAYRINFSKNSYYQMAAKKLVERHKKDLSTLFSHGRYPSPGDRRVLEFLEMNSNFVRGDGFFKVDGKFHKAFQRACVDLGYSLIPGKKLQSTYLSFRPNEIEKRSIIGNNHSDLPFIFHFRFDDKNNVLKLTFTMIPETDINKTARSILLDRLYIFDNFKSGFPVKSKGADYRGIVMKKIPFNPLGLNKDNLVEDVLNIFRNDVSGFVEEVCMKLREIYSS
jgi:hypothetical protein